MDSLNRRDFVKAGLGAAAGLSGIGRRLLAAADSAARPADARINLLFIMTDQQRWDALSRAGDGVLRTPNLDRLAREGAYFENAFTVCPVCAPARVAMLTGYNIQAAGVRRNEEIHREGVCQMPTFDDLLAGRGYWTEYFGKWHAPLWRALSYRNPVTVAAGQSSKLGPGLQAHYVDFVKRHVPPRDPGPGERLDRFSRRPYRPDPLDLGYGLPPDKEPVGPDGKPIPYRQCDYYGCLDVPPECTPTALYAGETIDALERLKGRPFSITCSIHHPHAPMIVPKPYHGMYPIDQMVPAGSIHDPMDNSPYAEAAARMKRYRDKDLIRYMMSDYYGLVREIDDHVGRILDKLKTLGLERNTLVIFTSDHGEMLGGHGMQEKNVFYEESVHVPLILRLPGAIPAGTVVPDPVSQIDLFATILDYLGAPAASSHGRSLRDVIGGRKRDADYVVSEWEYTNVPSFMVRTDRWKFLFARSPEMKTIDALYDLAEDPLELNNLIGRSPKRADWRRQADEMKERLVAWLEATDSPFLDGVKRRPVV